MLRSLRRLNSTLPNLDIVITQKDEKLIRKIDVQRKALIVHQQQAYKEGLIQPMINVLEKIQEAVKTGQETPLEKLEAATHLETSDSYATFMSKVHSRHGNLALDLYGSETDMRALRIFSKGELVPSTLKNEDAMIQYRKYFILNWGIPGAIENINPNKFIKMKPIHEFPLLPLVPISPATMKRFKEELAAKKAQGYKFRADRGKIYSGFLAASTFIVFLVLIYFLYRSDEENWVLHERNLRRKEDKRYGIY